MLQPIVRPHRGAGLTEYVIVVVLVAMTLVLAVMFFGIELIHGFGTRATPPIEDLDTTGALR